MLVVPTGARKGDRLRSKIKLKLQSKDQVPGSKPILTVGAFLLALVLDLEFGFGLFVAPAIPYHPFTTSLHVRDTAS